MQVISLFKTCLNKIIWNAYLRHNMPSKVCVTYTTRHSICANNPEKVVHIKHVHFLTYLIKTVTIETRYGRTMYKLQIE